MNPLTQNGCYNYKIFFLGNRTYYLKGCRQIQSAKIEQKSKRWYTKIISKQTKKITIWATTKEEERFTPCLERESTTTLAYFNTWENSTWIYKDINLISSRKKWNFHQPHMKPKPKQTHRAVNSAHSMKVAKRTLMLF